MTVTLELDPAVEARVIENAKERGMAVETYLKNLIEQATDEVLTEDAFESALDELAQIGAHLPTPDPTLTYSREDIYADHD